MKEQLLDWVSNPTKGLSVEDGGKKLVLSRIFLWFEDDFPPMVRSYLASQKLPEPAATAVASRRARIRYFAYDWSINRSP
mmetsp:Transcript_19092/g.44994  ORF Transcript_19092/g.44994 Transcript_19092/m.44994 type:complete len:80 (-) Transcript_19092:80-319(-)